MARPERVSQKGMRVRAPAAGSFRRRSMLVTCLAAAEQEVGRLRAELEAEPGTTLGRRRRVAQVAEAAAGLGATGRTRTGRAR